MYVGGEILFEYALNWWQGMPGGTQRFQHVGVFACRLGVLLSSDGKNFQRQTALLCFIQPASLKGFVMRWK